MGDPPGYSEVPPAAGPSSAPYGQSTLLHTDGKPTEPDTLPPAAWNEPTVNQYPPAGHFQYPAPPTAPAGLYGQPIAAAYQPSGFATPYGGSHPVDPQQQQQKVVVVCGGQPQPLVIRR